MAAGEGGRKCFGVRSRRPHPWSCAFFSDFLRGEVVGPSKTARGDPAAACGRRNTSGGRSRYGRVAVCHPSNNHRPRHERRQASRVAQIVRRAAWNHRAIVGARRAVFAWYCGRGGLQRANGLGDSTTPWASTQTTLRQSATLPRLWSRRQLASLPDLQCSEGERVSPGIVNGPHRQRAGAGLHSAKETMSQFPPVPLGVLNRKRVLVGPAKGLPYASAPWS